MEASVAIQVLPKVGSDETIRIVDEVIAYLKSSGLSCSVGPFETTVEGPYDQLMELVKECSLLCVRAGAPGVMTYVKISYSPSGIWTIDEKTKKHQNRKDEVLP